MSTLLVLCYALDSNHPVFPHQIDIVKAISKKWERVHVISYEVNVSQAKNLPSNVMVHNLRWSEKKTHVLIWHIMLLFFRITLSCKHLTVFSFMTESLSAIIGPFTKLMKFRHVLWYAHASHPKRLSWCHFWIDTIVTSTPTSCPITSKKVVVIGQAIDPDQFACLKRTALRKRSRKYIHVGRLDPSKNIMELIKVFQKHTNGNDDILHLVGTSTVSHKQYLDWLRSEISHRNLDSKVLLHGSKNQLEVKEMLCNADIFLHAFEGSLDKALVEAVFSRIFVISSNISFLKSFGSLTQFHEDEDIETFLSNELLEYEKRTSEELTDIIDSRYAIALNNHSRGQWLGRLEDILRHNDGS